MSHLEYYLKKSIIPIMEMITDLYTFIMFFLVGIVFLVSVGLLNVFKKVNLLFASFCLANVTAILILLFLTLGDVNSLEELMMSFSFARSNLILKTIKILIKFYQTCYHFFIISSFCLFGYVYYSFPRASLTFCQWEFTPDQSLVVAVVLISVSVSATIRNWPLLFLVIPVLSSELIALITTVLTGEYFQFNTISLGCQQRLPADEVEAILINGLHQLLELDVFKHLQSIPIDELTKTVQQIDTTDCHSKRDIKAQLIRELACYAPTSIEADPVKRDWWPWVVRGTVTGVVLGLIYYFGFLPPNDPGDGNGPTRGSGSYVNDVIDLDDDLARSFLLASNVVAGAQSLFAEWAQDPQPSVVNHRWTIHGENRVVATLDRYGAEASIYPFSRHELETVNLELLESLRLNRYVFPELDFRSPAELTRYLTEFEPGNRPRLPYREWPAAPAVPPVVPVQIFDWSRYETRLTRQARAESLRIPSGLTWRNGRRD